MADPKQSNQGVQVPLVFLAFGTVMRSSAADHNFLDWRFAGQTRLPFTSIDAMLELEESFFSIGINIVGN
jgi:hypothetical protein